MLGISDSAGTNAVIFILIRSSPECIRAFLRPGMYVLSVSFRFLVERGVLWCVRGGKLRMPSAAVVGLGNEQ